MIHSILTHKSIKIFFPFFTLLLNIPALWKGYWADDFFYRSKLLGIENLINVDLLQKESQKLPTVLYDLYTWINSGNIDNLIDYGLLPWWTSRDLLISFFRPLSAFTIWIDYQLWPNSLIFMHLHNLLWFVGIIFLVSIFFDRFIITPWISGLATLFFILDETFFEVITWLSNRSSLQYLFFALLAIIFHDKWRKEKSFSALFFSITSFILSILSAEGGIGIVAYLIAYALFIDNNSRLKKIFSLFPYFIVIILWRIFYTLSGYGALNSDFYIDPGRTPLRFLKALTERIPVLILSHMGIPGPDSLSTFSPLANHLIFFIALIFIILLLIICRFLLNNNSSSFLLTGMLLSAVPVCAVSLPDNRLLLLIGLGGMGLSAQITAAFFDYSNRIFKNNIIQNLFFIFCLLLIGNHTIRASWNRIKIFKRNSFSLIKKKYKQKNIFEQNFEEKDLIIINEPNPFIFFFFPYSETFNNRAFPEHIRILTPGFYPVKITRTDKKTLFVEKEKNNPPPLSHIIFKYESRNKLFRSSNNPIKEGDIIELKNLKIFVIKTDKKGEIEKVKYIFLNSLEDPSKVWKKWDWKKNTYLPFKLPEVGEAVKIEGPF